MSQNHHGAKAEPCALLETGAYKTRPYAFALTLWRHGHGREPHHLQLSVPGEDDR
jgi:hypothetical protein